MRIPSAWAQGIGQRIAQPARGVSRDRSGEIVGDGVAQFGQTVADIATDHLVEQKRETDRLERLRADSEARRALFAHENTVNQIAGELAAATEMPAEERRREFARQVGNVRASFMESVPVDYQFAFAPSFDEHRTAAESSLEQSLHKQMTDATRAAGQTARDQLVKSSRPLADKLQLLKDPDAWDWDAEGVSEETRAAEIARLAEEATGAEVEQRLNTDDPRQVLADLRATSGEGGDYSNYADLPPKTRQAYIRTARSAIEAQDKAAEQARKDAESERQAAAKRLFTEYKNRREALLPVDPQLESAMWKAVAGTDYEQQAREVRKTTGGLDYVTSKVNSDPLVYGAAQLGLQVPPLSVDNPADWPAQLAARVQVADVIRQGKGLPFAPVLTNDEATALAGLFKLQAPQAQIASLQMIGNATDAATLRKIAGQFAANDRELGAVTALIAEGKARAAYHVANGRKLLEEKAAQLPKILADEMREEFDDHLEAALAGMPQTRETLLRSAQLAYLSLAGAQAVPGEDLDDDLFEQALQSVAGEVTEYNGKRLMLPQGMDETAFLDAVKAIDATTIENSGGVYGYRSAAQAAEEIVDDAEFYETGTGRFRFVIDGQFLARADDPSRYFEIDFNPAQGGW